MGQVSKKLLVGVTNTISDSASTEKLLNVLLENYRSSVLPEILENWSKMSKALQIDYSHLKKFFCNLHYLVHFADITNIKH